MKNYLIILIILGTSATSSAKLAISEVADSLPENYFEKYYTTTAQTPFDFKKIEELKNDLDRLQSNLYHISEESIDNISITTLWSEIKKLIQIQKKITTSYDNFCKNVEVAIQEIADTCPNTTVKNRLKTIQNFINTIAEKRFTKIEELMGNKSIMSCGQIKTEAIFGYDVLNENLLAVSEKQVIELNSLRPLFLAKSKARKELDYGTFFLNNAINICFRSVDNEALKKRQAQYPESGLFVNFEQLKKDFNVTDFDITNNADSFKKTKDKAYEIINKEPVTDSFRIAVKTCLQKQMQRFIEPEAFYTNAKIEESKQISNKDKKPFTGMFQDWNRANTLKISNKKSYEKVSKGILSRSICLGDVKDCIANMEKAMSVETDDEICGDYKTKYIPIENRPASIEGAAK